MCKMKKYRETKARGNVGRRKPVELGKERKSKDKEATQCN